MEIVRTRILRLLLLAMLTVSTGCTSESSNTTWLKDPEVVKPGVERYRLQLDDNELWVYLPSPRPESLPCVVIAPAGTRMFHGMAIGEGDAPEHIPYAEAGYAVVCYGVSGALAGGENLADADVFRAARKFMKANGGVANGMAAVDWAIANIPGVDTNRIMSVGHSSAGTLSLQLAQNDQRVKACVSFMPVVDTVSYHEKYGMFDELESGVSGYTEFTKSLNPFSHSHKLQCPTLLFSSKDDRGYGQLVAFSERLEKTNSKASFDSVDSGGHYDPMIEFGIPAAIQWFGTL